MAQTCLVKFSQRILIFINTLFFLFGACFVGLGSYIVAAAPKWFSAHQQEIFNPSGLWVAIIFGIVVMAVSLAGCMGACRPGGCGKCFLFVYSAIVFVVILAEVIAGAVILLWGGAFGNVDNATTDKAVKKFNEAVNKFVNSTYQDCCVDKNKDSDVVCKTLKSQIADDKWCNDQATFKKDLLDWVQKNIKNIGIGVIVLGVIQILCLISACHVMCHATKSKAESEKPYDPNDPKQRAQRQQQGGDLAYGGPSPQPLV